MLITMRECIKRATYNGIPARESVINGNFSIFTVKDHLAKAAVQELLIRYSEPILFPDGLSKDELDKAIQQFVIRQVEDVVQYDFPIPKATPHVVSDVRFSPEQISKLTTENPKLLSSLQFTLDELDDDPYRALSVSALLPALAELENTKKPGFDLQVGTNEDAIAKLVSWMQSGKEHGRLIHNIENSVTVSNTTVGLKHAVYLDYKLVDGKPSVLMIDSYRFDDHCGEFLEFARDLKKFNKDVSVGGIELKAQSSSHGCHVFALNAAKQAYKNPHALDDFHQENVKNTKTKRKINAQDRMPANFMKHTQSSHALLNYFSDNEQADTATVNNKGETLAQYRARHVHLGILSKDPMMRSIYDKRLEYLLELKDALGVTFGNP